MVLFKFRSFTSSDKIRPTSFRSLLPMIDFNLGVKNCTLILEGIDGSKEIISLLESFPWHRMICFTGYSCIIFCRSSRFPNEWGLLFSSVLILPKGFTFKPDFSNNCRALSYSGTVPITRVWSKPSSLGILSRIPHFWKKTLSVVIKPKATREPNNKIPRENRRLSGNNA